jgi:hypothetical protein
VRKGKSQQFLCSTILPKTAKSFLDRRDRRRGFDILSLFVLVLKTANNYPSKRHSLLRVHYPFEQIMWKILLAVCIKQRHEGIVFDKINVSAVGGVTGQA